MSADVIPFKAREPKPEPTPNCPCRAGRLCYPHRLSNLRDLLGLHLVAHEGELVVPTSALEDAVTAAFEVIDGINSVCLPVDERRAP